MAFWKDKGRLLFIFIVGFVAFFISERVEAATCTYEFDPGYTFPGDVTVTYKYVFDVNLGNNELIYKNGTSVFSDGNESKLNGKLMVKAQLNGKQCPKLLLYTKSDYEFYTEKNQCTTFFGLLGCDDTYFHEISGTLSLEGDEELSQNNCDPADLTNYQQKKKDLVDNPYNSTYQKYYDQINALTVVDLESYAAAAKNFEVILNNFVSEINTHISKLDGFLNEYFCKEVTNQITKDLQDYQTKKNNDINRLKEILDQKKEAVKQQYIQNGDQASADKMDEFQQQTDNAADTGKSHSDAVISGIQDSVLENINFGSDVDAECQAILGNLVDIIQDVFNVIKIAAPILLLFFGTLDFAKAVISSDNDAIKKATSSFIKRVVAAVAIFFLPFLIEWIFTLIDIEGTLCGISKVVIK